MKLPESMNNVHQSTDARQEASFLISIHTLHMWKELSENSPEGKMHIESESIPDFAR